MNFYSVYGFVSFIVKRKCRSGKNSICNCDLSMLSLDIIDFSGRSKNVFVVKKNNTHNNTRDHRE